MKSATITHHYPQCSLDQYEQLFFNEHFNQVAAKTSKNERALKGITINNQPLLPGQAYDKSGALRCPLQPGIVVQREAFFASNRKIKHQSLAYIPKPEISFSERLVYHVAQHQGKIYINLTNNLCKATGTISLKQQGDGVDHVLSLSVDMTPHSYLFYTLKFFGLTGLVESLALEGVKKSFDEIQRLTEDWLKMQKPAHALPIGRM